MNVHIGTGAMDEQAYRELLERRNALQAEIRSFQEELGALNDIIAGFERLHQIRAGHAPTSTGGREHEPVDVPKRQRNAPSPRELASRARAELLKRGRPMTRGELVKALEESGIHLSGVDKAKNLGTILWRFQDEFLNIPGRGYWLKDVPSNDMNSSNS